MRMFAAVTGIVTLGVGEWKHNDRVDSASNTRDPFIVSTENKTVEIGSLRLQPMGFVRA